MKKNNFLTKAFTLLFVLLFNLTGARAIVTHTIYENGTATNTQVPIDGTRVGSYYTRSQFIIPKSQLQIMAGGKIKNMIFHTIADDDVVNWYSTNSGTTETKFDVYVTETTDNTLSAMKKWSTLTKVYSGKLAVNGNQLIVDFNSAFLYSGEKNLLIGIRQYQHSNNPQSSTFIGQTVNGASMGGYSSDADAYAASTSIWNNYTWQVSQQNFIPKTTFVYTPGFIPTDENVSFSIIDETDITGTPQSITANLSWSGDADSYEVRYRTKRPLSSENFNRSQLPTGWTVVKGSDVYGDGWNHELKDGSTTDRQMSSYSWHSGGGNQGTKYHADNWLISPAVELGGIVKFDVALSAWHDFYEVRVSTTGIAPADFAGEENLVRPLSPGISGREDFDLEKYKGQTGYIAIHHQDYDGYWISVDNFELSSGHNWKRAYSNGRETSVQLPRLLPDLEYEYVIVGIKNGVRGETANLTFSTPHVDDIILPDNEDNEDLVYDVAGKTYNAYLEGRTFKDNGIWNTLALPFDVTVKGSDFEDAAIYTVLDRSSVVNGLLTLRIDPLQPTTLKAGTPYLVTWEGAKGLYEPIFSSVAFKNEMHEVRGGLAGGTAIVFKPNFNYLDFTNKEDESILFLSNNNLYSAGDGAKIKPQRGYFQVSDGSPVRGMVFDIVDEETAIESVNGAFNNNPWYDLNGRKLTGKPAQKGIYINNGKKTIIK